VLDRSIDRRAFLRTGVRAALGGLVLAGGGGLLEACSSSSSSAARTSSAPRRIAPRPGGTLVVGTTNEINSLDVFVGELDSPGILYARAVFDPITAVAEDGSVRPYLAESLTPSPDYTEWTIALRPGVVFHDGTPLDASALKYFFDAMLATTTLKPSLALIERVSVAGPGSVRLSMAQPWVAFPAYLCGNVGTSQIGYVMAPSMIRNPKGGLNPVGTGPFVFNEWVQGDHFSVTRNPHYWRAPLPYLDGLEFRPIVAGASRAASLLSGAIDLLQTQSPEVVDELSSSRSVVVTTNRDHVVGEPEQNFVMLNTAVPPLDDLSVRQALAYGLDAAKLVSTTLRGLEAPSTGPFAPGTPYYAPTGYPSYDPAKAKRLVDAYVARHGPLRITIMGSQSAFYTAQAELIQAMWRQVGIEASIAPATSDTTGIAETLVGRYQAELWQQFGTPDPDLNYIFWASQFAAPVGSFATNFARNKDPVIDKELETARSNPDPAVRAAAYQEVARRLAADLPYLWISRVLWAVAHKASVHGVLEPTLPDGRPADWFNAGDVWLTQAFLSKA
jgi:peptide/nickel transport system substrate-binding protein